MPLRCRWMDPALTVLLAASLVGSAVPAIAQSSLSPGYAAADARYSPAERAGREIWFFATAFNDRFFTYSYPQRLGAAIDWYSVLGAKNKKDLFQAWGAIPDPDCCVPGDAELPGREPGRDLRLPVVPGRRRAAEARRQGGLSRSRLRLQGRPVRHHHAPRRGRSAPERLRSPVRHLDRGARACASSPIRASTAANGAS